MKIIVSVASVSLLIILLRGAHFSSLILYFIPKLKELSNTHQNSVCIKVILQERLPLSKLPLVFPILLP